MKKIKLYICAGLASVFMIAGAGSAFAGWCQDGAGWWYQRDDQSYPKSEWMQDGNGKWYYFDENGYMKTGWITDNGKSYYLGQDGAMLVNAVTPDGYYVDGSGVWQGQKAASNDANSLALERSLEELSGRSSEPLYYMELDANHDGRDEIFVTDGDMSLESLTVLEWVDGRYREMVLPIKDLALAWSWSLFDSGVVEISGGMEFEHYNYGYRMSADGTWNLSYRGEVRDPGMDEDDPGFTQDMAGNFINDNRISAERYYTDEYWTALESYRGGSMYELGDFMPVE